MTVLKLGGSVVTEKDTPETLDGDAIDRAAEAIAAAGVANGERSELVVVHGGGSFGHHHASRHGVSTTSGSRDASALTEIHRAMGDLNEAVVDGLQSRGVDALPVRPLSVAYRTGSLVLPTGGVDAMLSEGFVPVLHGDVVVDAGAGGTVLSGDEIVGHLAESLDADRIGLCSTVPGVLDDGGAVVPEITSYDEVSDALGESEATDVTGGMARKVERLLELGMPASVFDLDSLGEFLETGRAGTVVIGE